MELSKRQQEIFDFIRRHAEEHGYPPTVRDIGRAVGLTSPSTVHAHLAKLERAGMLRRDPTKPRAIELLGRAAAAGRERLRSPGLPLLGTVAAGQPVLAEENIEEYVPIPGIAGGEEAQYILRVHGDSMIDAGILDGDYVVVRSQETAQDGDIVVALLEEEATVKRFFREADQVCLKPENPTMEPIRGRDIRLLGRVVGLLRSMR